MSGEIAVLLDSPDWVTKPVNRNAKVFVQVINKIPQNGKYKYQLRYVAQIPGQHNLKSSFFDPYQNNKHLETDIFIEIKPLLTPKYNGILEDTAHYPFVAKDYYYNIVAALVLVWGVGFFVLIFSGRSKKQTSLEICEEELSWEERIARLAACELQNASSSQKKNAEILFIQYWRHKLHLEKYSMEESIEHIKAHPKYGKLLCSLESCMHDKKDKQNLATVVKNIQESMKE